ncbi:hypothetical protein Cgig2_016930 [Carnegiea gigantea]|uniref:Aminotransferase-like plant mobile domain-containing protein n=1 Tax=Carnegiea gigantea TaxID=171969 RepID=A0A9Q1GZB9_9CARY|nr:hypothetical protein Cgig2_016930 [Carnegiea gigantea]
MEEVLKEVMEERVSWERQMRMIVHKDISIYKNCVLVLLELCSMHNEVQMVSSFRKLYTFLIVSGLFFLRCAGGVTWNLISMVKDVDEVSKYNWSEAMQDFLVEAMEEIKEKMRITKNLQIGFAKMSHAWFYEHTSMYASADKKRMSRLSSCVNFYKGKKYNTGVAIKPVTKIWDVERSLQVVEAFVETDECNAYVEDAQVYPIVTFVRCNKLQGTLAERVGCTMQGKKSHVATKKELEEFNEAIALNITFGTVPNDVELKDVPQEGTNTTMGSPEAEL